MAHSLPWVRASSLLVFAAALFVGTPTTAKAQAIFDGLWSILIVTEAGDCDRAFRYGVEIQRGRIFYEGGAGIELSGRVDRNGRVSARIQRGDQGATGTGRLYRNRGVGRWRGQSPTGQCSGYWEAERR